MAVIAKTLQAGAGIIMCTVFSLNYPAFHRIRFSMQHLPAKGL